MKANLERQPGHVILRVGGDLRLWGKREVEGQLLRLLRAEPQLPGQLVLNIAEIHHLDTAGICEMVRVIVECTKREVDLKLVLPRGVPGEALRRLHIFDAWQEFREEAAAVQAAASASAGSV